MIGTCAACGNHEWDKEVIEDLIRCPKFDKIDCSYGTPREIAETINNWLMENFGNDNPN